MLDPHDKSLFSVASVTPGTQGSVEISREGSLTYTPKTREQKPDQFTVTLQDSEGGSVRKRSPLSLLLIARGPGTMTLVTGLNSENGKLCLETQY